MNAEPKPHPAPPVSDKALAEALTALFKLPDDALASIRAASQAMHLPFGDAALHTGLVTQRELNEALEWARSQPGPVIEQRRGIIEEMLHRNTARSDVVLWEGAELVPGPRLTLAHDPDSPRSEGIRTLRTELLMRTAGRRGAGIFALLSPCAGEGRSQLCAELAIAFAQLGSKTLLVDADMRNPQQHLLFGADNDIGLAQALVDSSTVRMRRVKDIPQLAVLTSGGIPPNPLELLLGNRFERLVSDWRRSCEYVVIDTPPTSQFSDALALATVAGNVVVVGRAHHTLFKDVKEMSRKLETTRARVVGAVLNQF